MGRPTVVALRVVLALLFAGSLFMLAVMVPVMAQDIDVDETEIAAWQPKALIAISALGIMAAQVILVCVLAPGEAAAPGVVLIVSGISLVILGVALVTLVMRALLGQAVARDVEAKHLQSELDVVI